MNPYAATSMYYCQFHEFMTQEWSHWIIHLKMHNISNTETQCPICFTDFENNTRMISHLMNKRHHELFVCRFCGKGLSSKHSMVRHQVNTCKSNKPSIGKVRIPPPVSQRVGITEKFKCQYCNKELSSEHSLQRHQENTNACERNRLKIFRFPQEPAQPQKKVRCGNCGTVLSSRRSLRRHQQSLNACEMKVIIEIIPMNVDELFTDEQTKILDSLQFETIEMLKNSI